MRRSYVALVTILLLTACGGDSQTGVDPYEQVIPGSVSVFGTTEHSVTVPRSGNMTVRLNWTDANIDLDLYLTGPDCTGYPPVDCNVLAASDAIGTNEESVQRSVSASQQFKLWVDNFSETQASNYTLTLRIN